MKVAAVLIQYRTIINNMMEETVSLKATRAAIYEHFETDHPDLLPALKLAERMRMKDGLHGLVWVLL